MKISLPHNRWFGDAPVNIDLPEKWDVHVAKMAGDSLSALSYEQLHNKINKPFGSPVIRELARGKESVCILFDDMSRATPCVEIAHILLDELLAAGIKKDKILFMCALGMHGALERDDFIKKLGEDIVAEYPVYNHNPFDNCVTVGTTSRGIEAKVNSEVLKYDVKIAIGVIVPHPIAGFSGGCKIILPGVSAIETIYKNHQSSFEKVWFDRTKPFSYHYGNLQNVDMREDAEEVAMLMGLNYKVDVLLNTRCEIIDVFAGHPIIEYYEGVKKAFKVYATEHFEPVDVCILNANSKPNEAFMAMNIGMDCIKDGGDLVMVNFCPTGIVNHYLSTMWGLHTGGSLSLGNKEKEGLPAKIRKMIIFSPYRQYTTTIFYGRTEQVLWAKTWEEVLELLGNRRAKIKAAVLMDALLEMFSDPFKLEYEPVNIKKNSILQD